MIDRINKPRAFLSYSSKDKDFIENLADDLRKCQIEPWLDTKEIRDGRSWQKMIFEDGISTCDVIIIYLTENSITSKMVAKEIDASFIEQLSDSGIVLLPYVSKGALREKLRSDIRSLHCRELNQNNYSEVLPSVVSEIWRSYFERTINAAVAQEKSKRLEKELALKDLEEKYQGAIFSPSENADFQYIYKRLNEHFRISFGLHERGIDGNSGKDIGLDVFEFSFIDLLAHYLKTGYYSLEYIVFTRNITDILNENGFPEEPPKKQRYYGNAIFDGNRLLELSTFGFVDRIFVQTRDRGDKVKYEFSNKVHRFQYWLGYNNLINDRVSFKFIKHEPHKEKI